MPPKSSPPDSIGIRLQSDSQSDAVLSMEIDIDMTLLDDWEEVIDEFSNDVSKRVTTSDTIFADLEDSYALFQNEEGIFHRHDTMTESIENESAQASEVDQQLQSTDFIEAFERLTTGGSANKLIHIDQSKEVGGELMTEKIHINSKEWVGDHEPPSDPFPEFPSGHEPQSISPTPPHTNIPFTNFSSNNSGLPTPPPTTQTDFKKFLFQRTESELEMMLADDQEINFQQEKTESRTVPSSRTKSTSSSNKSKSKSKRRPKRIIDESRVCEPTEHDVLFGRGGFTNTHPGNIKFREEALKLRDWYESATKEEKYTISDLLVETIRGDGHRFLEKGSDGLWHEVIGNGARKKASQALRERLKKNKPLEDCVIGSDAKKEEQKGEPVGKKENVF